MSEPVLDARGWRWTGTEWVPPVPEPMTVYDILRKLLSHDLWSELELEEARQLIDKLELNGVLGNRAAELTTREEEPV